MIRRLKTKLALATIVIVGTVLASCFLIPFSKTPSKTFSEVYPNAKLISDNYWGRPWQKKFDLFDKEFENIDLDEELRKKAFREFGMPENLDIKKMVEELEEPLYDDMIQKFIYNWCNKHKESRNSKTFPKIEKWCTAND